MRYLKSNQIFDISTVDSVQYAWIPCIGAYLSQGVVPGNNRLVKGVVDRRRGEADHSLSLEAGATGPGGSETQRRVVVTLLVIILTVPRPLQA